MIKFLCDSFRVCLVIMSPSSHLEDSKNIATVSTRKIKIRESTGSSVRSQLLGTGYLQVYWWKWTRTHFRTRLYHLIWEIYFIIYCFETLRAIFENTSSKFTSKLYSPCTHQIQILQKAISAFACSKVLALICWESENQSENKFGEKSPVHHIDPKREKKKLQFWI